MMKDTSASQSFLCSIVSQSSKHNEYIKRGPILAI